MAENKILPWAQTSTANALSDADYAADVATGGSYADGVKSGQASSKQANKTWRQATAPGSGLGQFIVDNLSVDVTDADTPATFSTRIANAVLKLAQVSPFNSAWATATGGYRKYAIVSDSSGNFWVSTADQNTTVPGASGAKWQSLFNGYATQAWSDGRYIQKASGPNDYTPIQGGVNKSTGNIWFSYNDGTGLKYAFAQPAGDYATNPALQAETQRATTAENGLQSSKANLNGGNSYTGAQSIYNAPVVVHNSPSLASGDWNYSPGLIARTDSRAGVQIFAQDQVNGEASVVLVYEWNAVAQTYWWFSSDGSINNSVKGEVAFQSDLPLPVGQKIFTFTATVTGSNQNVALPQAMSNVLFATAQGGTDGQGTGMTNVNSWTNNSINVSVASYHTGAPQRATITQTFLVVAIP